MAYGQRYAFRILLLLGMLTGAAFSLSQLCLDLMQQWIKQNPQASICTGEGVSEFKDVANFQDYHGLPDFRKVITITVQRFS